MRNAVEVPEVYSGPPALEQRCERVLVVEDELNSRRILHRYLVRLGLEVSVAEDVPGALELLSATDYDLVVTDLKLPGASGVDLLTEIRVRSPGTRAILMSGHADVQAASAAIERGIDHLLLKPFGLDLVRESVLDSLSRKRVEQEARAERDQLRACLRRQAEESRVWILRAAHALASAVEAKDEYTAGHAFRVTAYALTLAEEIGGVDLVRFRLAGDLHDVGKIGVPDEVLKKPGRLTEEEFALIRRHPEAGARILEPLMEDEMVLGVVRWHHERWDGRGYPDALAGEAIPLPARILAVADTLDAMTSHRAYRRGLPWEQAVAEIRRCSGTQFDPLVVEAFERVLARLQAQYQEFERAPGVPRLRVE